MESLKEENRRLKDTMLCKICMDEAISTLFLPCSHLVCCDGCAPTLRECPICRTAIRGTVRTYISWTHHSVLLPNDCSWCKWMCMFVCHTDAIYHSRCHIFSHVAVMSSPSCKSRLCLNCSLEPGVPHCQPLSVFCFLLSPLFTSR